MMRKPDESLEDFQAIPIPEVPLEPPRWAWLRASGEVENLKPLARLVPVSKPEVAATRSPGLSWFHRSLIGAGAFALIAVVFASAVLIAIFDRNTERATVSNIELVEPEDGSGSLRNDERLIAGSSAGIQGTQVSEPPTVTHEPDRVFDHSSVRAARTIRSVQRNRSRRSAQTTEPEAAVSKFIPTTLIIYIENGEIKSRVEPQLVSSTRQ